MATQTPETTDTAQMASQDEHPEDSGPVQAATPVSADAAAPEQAAAPPKQKAPARPIHPMPFHFPELRHNEPKAVAPAPPAPPVDPHSVHDADVKWAPERSLCVRCGSSNLARGYVVDYGDKFRQVHFAPRRVTLRRLNSLLNLFPFRGIAKLDAIACRDCGAVLLVVEPGELRRAERRRE